MPQAILKRTSSTSRDATTGISDRQPFCAMPSSVLNRRLNWTRSTHLPMQGLQTATASSGSTALYQPRIAGSPLMLL